jgi:hypothetical protein
MKGRLIIAVSLYFMTVPALAQNPATPSARSGYSLVYDTNRGVVVLFGGQDSANKRLDDTWEWSEGVWTRIKVPGPAARMNAAMAYDPAKKLAFLFGGRSETGTENDLWAFDGKAWATVKTAVSPPPARQLGTMVFDKGQSAIVLFGGMDVNKKTLGDTWILQDGEWKALNAAGPSPRASHAMAYDEGLRAVIIYGGYIDGAASRESWAYKDGAWRELTNHDGPVRIHAALSYDTEKKRLLLFGGFNERDRTNELWEYANGRWAAVAGEDDKTPAPRAEHRSVFILGRGLFVFGGVIGPDANTRNRGNDTWIYGEGGWRCLK